MGTPAEHPSKREGQNHIIIKDFPGVFIRPPFQSPPPTPSQEDPAHPFCRSQKLRRGVTRTQSGEVVLHAIDVRSALDSEECGYRSSAGDSSLGYSESAGDVAKLYQGSSEDSLSKGDTDLGLAQVEVAANTVDSSRWELLSDTPEDISLNQLTYSGDLQKDVQENSSQEPPTLDNVAQTSDFSAGEFQGVAT